MDTGMNIEFAKKEVPLGTIFELVELSAKDVVAARDRMIKADNLAVVDHQFDGIFDLYSVMSGDRIYEVIRLGYFVKCNCRSFEFTHGACKHVGLVLPAKCSVCFEREVEVKGKCRDCYQLTEGFLHRPEPSAPAFVSTGTL